MARGGKHEKPKNAESGEKKQAAAGRRKKRRVRKRAVSLWLGIPTIVILLLFCVFMISPLRGCVLGDEGYIGSDAALELAISDSGIIAERAQDQSCKMVMIDGKACYKIEFSGSVAQYRYILDAQTGEIIREAVKSLEGG